MQPAPTPPPTAAPRKKGIFYGWWVVASAVSANFAYAEQFNSSFGVFVRALGDEMGWGRTALSGVQSIGRIPEVILVSLLGPFVDQHGARWLVGIGGLIVGGAFLALATIEELWQLYLYRGFLTALGSVCLGGFLGVTVSNWFQVRRGRALGVMSMGSSTANAVSPLLTAFLVQSLGWRQAWFVTGLLIMVLVIPAVIFFRRRPEDIGLLPDGRQPREGEEPALSQRERRRREELIAADVTWTRRQVLGTPAFWIISFAFGCSSLAITATNLHTVPYLQDLGYALPIAAGAISFRSMVSVFGGGGWGYAVERIPHRVALTIPFVVQALAMLSFFAFSSTEGIILALVVYGIGYSGVSVLSEYTWASYFGRISLGTVRSLVMPVQMALGAAGPLAMGLIFDMFQSYQNAWLVLACGFAIAAVLIQFARRPTRREVASP